MRWLMARLESAALGYRHSWRTWHLNGMGRPRWRIKPGVYAGRPTKYKPLRQARNSNGYPPQALLEVPTCPVNTHNSPGTNRGSVSAVGCFSAQGYDRFLQSNSHNPTYRDNCVLLAILIHEAVLHLDPWRSTARLFLGCSALLQASESGHAGEKFNSSVE
jgi:hypothetical protein